ncbi:MAG: GTP-binding protein, partial [Gallionella sp.]
TRNMVTAASTANLVVILIDARRGVLVQTRRHTYLASLVGVPHIVLAVNKMDMVEYSQARFDEIVTEYKAFAAQLNLHDVTCIPLSALVGDMVVDRGDSLNWYQGPTLMEKLESVEIDHDVNTTDFRFPVQWVCRPQTDEHHDFRGFMGRIEAGEVSVGDEVTVLPSGRTSTVKEIVTYDGNLQTAFAPQSITLTLNDEIDISRGDMFVKAEHMPTVAKEFEAMLCWLSEAPLDKNRKYLVKHTTRTAKCLFSKIDYRVDVNTLEHLAEPVVNMNDIVRVGIKVQQPLAFDHYTRNRASGSFIVIDEANNNTVAAGMIV